MTDFNPFMPIMPKPKPKPMMNLFNDMPVYKVRTPDFIPMGIDWGDNGWPDFCLVVLDERD